LSPSRLGVRGRATSYDEVRQKATDTAATSGPQERDEPEIDADFP